MSKIKPDRAYAAAHFEGFAGLGGAPFSNTQKATEMQNFRICADGSLKKRRGYRALRKFPNTVRAYWEGTVGSQYRIFAVSGTSIYTVDLFSGMPTQIGSVSSVNVAMNFLQFGSELYLPDAGGLQVFYQSTGRFERVTPYIPLYGKNWDPTSGGALNETVNVFSNHIRVHYTNHANTSVFVLPFYAKAIDGVLVNGTLITDYNFVSGEKTLYIPEGSTGVDVEIGMEIYLEEDSMGIHTAQHGIVHRGSHYETLCLYGSQQAYRLYCSTHVLSADLLSAQRIYTNSRPLYFLSENILSIGNAQFPLNTVCAYGNLLLAYSDTECHKIEFLDDGAPISTPLLSGIGCTAASAAILCNGSPITVNQKGVYRLRFTSEKSPPETIRLSDDIADLLSAEASTRWIAREEPHHNELWLHDPYDEKKRIFVYSFDKKEWYVFTDFSVTFFFSIPLWDGFASSDTVYLLDETLSTDDGKAIVAQYQSGYFSFSHPEAKKRALRITACIDGSDDTTVLRLESERSERELVLVGDTSNAPEVFDCRALMGRFRFLRFRLSSAGTGDSRLYSLSFYANL